MSAFKDWLNGLTSKTTFNDADELYVRDSATGQSNKGTWANLLAALNITSAGRDLVIVGIGDSHMNGQIPTAVSASDTLGNFALTSPKDKQWAGTDDSPYFKANSQINVTTGTTDPNLSVAANSGSFLGYIPSLLRSAYPNIGRIRIANLGVGGASSFSWAGETAFAYCVASALPLDGDTFTVDGIVYTWRAAASSAYEVTIGASANASNLNLANAINAEGTGFGAGTVVHPTCFCPLPISTQYLRIHAKSTGTGGNSLQLSSSAQTRMQSASSSLAPSAPVSMAAGSATSALYANGKAALNGGAGIGAVSVFVVTLGTNDSIRPGFRGVNTQAELTKLISNIKTDYPGVPIIFWRPMTMTGSGLASLNSKVLPAIDAVVAADPTNVFSIDFNSLGAGTGDMKILRAADGLHATSYGYSVLAQMFATKIADVLDL